MLGPRSVPAVAHDCDTCKKITCGTMLYFISIFHYNIIDCAQNPLTNTKNGHLPT